MGQATIQAWRQSSEPGASPQSEALTALRRREGVLAATDLEPEDALLFEGLVVDALGREHGAPPGAIADYTLFEQPHLARLLAPHPFEDVWERLTMLHEAGFIRARRHAPAVDATHITFVRLELERVYAHLHHLGGEAPVFQCLEEEVISAIVESRELTTWRYAVEHGDSHTMVLAIVEQLRIQGLVETYESAPTGYGVANVSTQLRRRVRRQA